jgi:opacity protein-like surface antigen
MNFWRICGCLSAWLLFSGTAASEDTEGFRPYLRFHSGDIEPLWGVDDHWSLGLGADVNRHWGGELSLEFFERFYELPGIGELGEISAWNLIPEVRLRRASRNKRWVTYLLAGVGRSFLQFNDPRTGAFGRKIDIEGMSFAVAVGGGLDYFFADNLTLGVQGRYMWINPIDGWVDGQRHRVDMSAPMFTFGMRAYFSGNDPKPPVTVSSPGQRRLYFGVRAGGSVLTEDRWVPGVRLEPEPSGWGALNQTGALTLGMDWHGPLGVELVADSLEKSVHVKGEGGVAEYGMGIAIPQLRVRYPVGSGKWMPYATAGIGIAFGEINDHKKLESGLRLDAWGLNPALSAGAGLEYFIVRNVSLHSDLRWIYTWGHTLKLSGQPRRRGDFSALLLTLGFKAYFLEF